MHECEQLLIDCDDDEHCLLYFCLQLVWVKGLNLASINDHLCLLSQAKGTQISAPLCC